MGTWGPHIFDNDVAADWLSKLVEGDFRAVEATLDALLDDDSDDGYDSDLAGCAIAAADVVAKGAAKGDAGFVALVGKAQMAVMAAAGSGSELSALWQEAGVEAHEEWIETLRALQAQLSGEQSVTPVTAISDQPQDMMFEAIETRLRGLDADMQMMRADIIDEIQKLRRFIQEQRT